MSKYKMEDGTIVDTARAAQSWDEYTVWDGSARVSVNTKSEWNHERLHMSSKGRFWIEEESQWQGAVSTARRISRRKAAIWLLTNHHQLPNDLEDLEGE